MDEIERIKLEYARREREIPADFYSIAKIANLFGYQQRVRRTLLALTRCGFIPLTNRVILEIGCGTGDWLADFESWGASRRNLHGIELDQRRAETALSRLSGQTDGDGRVVSAGADIRVGDASHLPWPNQAFDLVLQSTVFTSILQYEMKQAIAREMVRVLRPGGALLWYDFRRNNPFNPNVRGIDRPEIERLFPGGSLDIEALTLAPPLSRRIVPWSWSCAMMLEKLPFLRTHYLAVIRP